MGHSDPARTFELGLSSEASSAARSGGGRVEAGERIGRYVVRRRLGAGAMGVVVEAYDPPLHRTVAIKLLEPTCSGAAGLARMAREARSLAALSHPHVVAVFDVGLRHDGVRVGQGTVARCG